MMHYHPELVNLSETGNGDYTGFKPQTLRDGVAWIPRDWGKVSKDTGIGNPKLATAEKGARFASAVASRYADLLNDLVHSELY